MTGRTVVAAGLLFGMLCAAAFGQERVLCMDGATDYEIVLPGALNQSAKEGADDFIRYMERSTGAKFRVVRSPSPGKPHVFIGASEHTEKLGVSVKDLPPETLRVKTVGADIVLAGVDVLNSKVTRILSRDHTETGTMSAVYEFLERVAGMRWYGDDELYEIIPAHKRLVVPDLDITESPAFSYRYLTYSPNDSLRRLLGRRWKLGNSRSIAHSHAWSQVLPPEKYGDHPEYYAELNGRRVVPKPDVHSGWQVCTSNPEVVRIFIDTAVQYFKDNPKRNMFSISPNDGTHFCGCAACRALDTELFPEGGNNAGMPVLTDRMLTFYNAVAEGVSKEFPDRYLGAYIYSFYQKPPKRETRVHPNLVLFRTLNSAWSCGTEEAWGHDVKRVTAWGDLLKTGNYLYEIYYWPKQVLCLPQPNADLAVRRTRFWKEAGVDGAMCYVYPTWESGGPTAYLLAKMLWNPKADADKLHAEYYSDLYGAAAAPVRKYYDALTAAWARGMDGEDAGSDAAKYYAAGGKNEHLFATELRSMEPFIEAGSALLDDAAQRVKGDPLCAQRLQRLRDQHDVIVWTTRGLAAAAAIQRTDRPPRDAYASMKEAIEKRQQIVETIRGYAKDYVENYLLAEEGRFDSPMSPSSGYLAFSEAALAGKGQMRNLLPEGTFENLPAGKDWPEKNLRFFRVGDGSTVDVVNDNAAHGKQSLHVVLPADCRAISFGNQVRTPSNRAYKITLLFRTAGGPQVEDGESTGVLNIRVRYDVPNQKDRVTSNRAASVSAGMDGWTRVTHIFTVPEKVNRFSWSVLMSYPCEYWFDDLEIQEVN